MAAPPRFTYKAYEIEERVDLHFYRRLGYVAALWGQAGRLSPNALSVLAGVVGVAGGALLYDEALAAAGFGLLVLHGILDSADGQLARLTGRTSELGRILDGVAGYATHIAMLAALALAALHRGAGYDVLIWASLAGVSVAVHAQLYEYHRVSYLRFAIEGRVPAGGTASRAAADPVRRSGMVRMLYAAAGVYEAMQRRLAGRHAAVEAAVALRAPGGRVAEGDRERYRAFFYPLVRGWNSLGDNGRRFLVGALIVAGRLDWFFLAVLGPMNLLAVVLWIWQWRTDRRFLEGL